MASEKKFTEVLIDGKVITLAGYEGEEYLQKVATYLNHKISECKSSKSYTRQNAAMQSILLALNVADDYFKTKKLADTLERNMEDKDKEMYDLKHELISTQLKLENAETLNQTLRDQITQLQKEQVKLETQINVSNK